MRLCICESFTCLLFYLFAANIADVVHVTNHWILAQTMAHAPVPNFDVRAIAFVL